MLGQLIPAGGGDPIPLLKARIVVGRRPSCDVILEYSNVSSQHCELLYDQGYWKMRDLGSSNGSKVNGVRQQERWLNPGDEITFAKHRFHIDFVPGSSGPAPVNEEESPFAKSLLEKAGLAEPEYPPRPRSRASAAAKTPKPSEKPRNVQPPSESSGTADNEDDVLRWLSDE